jgi:hypothetical protein
MGYTFNTVSGDQLNTTRRVTPGWYHAVLVAVTESDKADSLAVKGDVLAGKPNDPKETDVAGCGFNLTFWFPKASDTEQQQEKTNAKLTALFIASDLVTPEQLGQPVEIEPSNATGRHVLVHIRFKQKKVTENGKEIWVDDPQFLDLAFNDILHIDDPAGANVPKNVGALKFIDAKYRHPDAKYFAFKARGGAAAAGSTAAPGGTMSAPPTGGVASGAAF